MAQTVRFYITNMHMKKVFTHIATADTTSNLWTW